MLSGPCSNLARTSEELQVHWQPQLHYATQGAPLASHNLSSKILNDRNIAPSGLQLIYCGGLDFLNTFCFRRKLIEKSWNINIS